MRKLIIILMLLILFSQGCAFSSGSVPQYNKGLTGLEIEYNSNLKELYEGDVVNINLLLKNDGAYDINNGILKLSVEENYLEVKKRTKEYFELTGGAKDFPEGESSSIMFSISAKELDEKSIERETNFHITSCYDYGTDLTIDACIDSDVYNINKEKVCTPGIKAISGGQGAPVTINNVETRMIYDEENDKIIPSFSITIKNKGMGTVIKKNKVDEICSSEGVNNDDFNIINLNVYITESGQLVELECSQNLVKLRDGEKKVVCNYNSGFDIGVGTYYTPLHIKLKYGYMEVISKNIKIKKINT